MEVNTLELKNILGLLWPETEIVTLTNFRQDIWFPGPGISYFLPIQHQQTGMPISQDSKH